MTWLTPAGGYLQEHERPAVDQTVSILGLRHHYVMVNQGGGDAADMGIINSGSVRGRSKYSLVASMASVAKPGDVFVRGYGGEIIRGFYNIQPDPMTAASPREFGRMYQKRNPKLHPFVQRAFEGFWERANWDKLDGFGYDVNDLFYWEHRMGMWGAMMLNQMDSAVECWVGMNSRPLYRAAFGLEPRDRLTKALFTEAIERLHGPLSTVPVL